MKLCLLSHLLLVLKCEAPPWKAKRGRQLRNEKLVPRVYHEIILCRFSIYVNQSHDFVQV